MFARISQTMPAVVATWSNILFTDRLKGTRSKAKACTWMLAGTKAR
jgi:hypothetical protein